jgi:hypothetical protein
MKPLLGGWCALLLFCIRALSDSVVLIPAADTTISEDNKAQAIGTATNMIVGHLNPDVANVTARALLRFDLSSLPSGAVVTSAVLSVFLTRNASDTANMHALHRLDLGWLETAATWLSSGLASWETPGGDFEATADATANIGTDTGTYTFSSTTALVNTVQMWATNAASNKGWILRSLSEEGGRNARRFHTREAEIDPPMLTVGYSLPPPPPADFNVTTPASYFAINGLEPNPELTLTRGSNYTFAIDTDPSHPFQIASDPDGSSYDDGVVNNNISSGRITFTVPSTAPDTLYYVCSVHFFGGTIHIVDPAAPAAPLVQILSVDLSSSNVVLKSTGTNGWLAVPEFSSNLVVSNWTVVPQFSNSFLNGTNITVFNRLEPICGPNVFLRMKNVKN